MHSDEIAALPPGATALADNDFGLQAAWFTQGRGTFWGVQYHPEYSYGEIAATAVRYGDVLVTEGLFRDHAELDAYAAELRELQASPQDTRLNWRHGLGPAMSDPALKLAEIAN